MHYINIMGILLKTSTLSYNLIESIYVVYITYKVSHNDKLGLYTYRILSKNSSLTVSRKIRHLVANRIGMSKLAEVDEYLDFLDETLERTAKLWSTLLAYRGVSRGEKAGFELTIWTAEP